MTAKFTVSKARYDDGEIIESTYVYRGVEFSRGDNVMQGYYGRYSIKFPKNINFPRTAFYQADVKKIIDRYIESKD